MKFKSVLLVGAMVALMGSLPVFADPVITVTYNGSAHLGTPSGVGYIGGRIHPGPNGAGTDVSIGGVSLISAAAGSFGLPGSPPSGAGSLGQPFDAWCVDIGNWLAVPTSVFTVSTPAVLAATLTTVRGDTPIDGFQRVEDLNKLASAHYDSLSTAVNKREYSAAFQLAVWAITYGTYSSGYSVTGMGPGFYVDSSPTLSTSINLADGWLSGLANAAVTTNYSFLYLEDASDTRKATQDMIVIVKTPPATIPEPGTIALLGIGLLAASLIRRRRG